MEAVELKLKQASAVLGVAPKDLQNLIQFKVLRPSRRDSIYWFDNRLLLEAKIALYLKDSLGTSTDVLTLFARALSSLSDEHVSKARYLSLRSRPAKGREAIEVRVPSKIWRTSSTNSSRWQPCTRTCHEEESDQAGSASSRVPWKRRQRICPV